MKILGNLAARRERFNGVQNGIDRWVATEDPFQLRSTRRGLFQRGPPWQCQLGLECALINIGEHVAVERPGNCQPCEKR